MAFLLLVVSGWGGGRFIALLPDDVVQPLVLASERAAIPAATAAEVRPVMPRPRSTFAALAPPVTPAQVRTQFPLGRHTPAAGALASVVVAATRAAASSDTSGSTRQLAGEPPPPGLPTTLPTPMSDRRSRWSGSAWAIVRDGGGASLLSPLLGGSQAGVRIAYSLDGADRIAVYARIAAPLKHGSVEPAAGVQWRPTRAPVTVYAEVRAARGTASPAVGLFGGGAIALPAKFRLEGYGQAGLIRRDGVSGFGDGQVRAVRPLGPVELGAGIWGAAQRGASRLDVGPSLAVPIAADPVALRVTLDWRHRVAGNARPTSGPALSLGADF